MLRSTLILVLGLALPGCSDTPTGPSDLVGVAWRLVAIEPPSGPATVVPNPERYTLEFLDEGRVALRADCNSCSGPYTFAGDTLTMPTLACTRAFCGTQSLDTAFTRGLEGPLSVSRDQSLLILRGAQATLRFRSE
jgi:heat shock protein HslJ